MAMEDERWQEQLERLRDRLSLPESCPSLPQALTHPSYRNERPAAGGDNQRLEFLGDAVLGLCVSELLMEAFASVDEGQLTVMRAALVNARALATAAKSVDLAAAVRLGHGADHTGARHRTNVLADALEAVIGATYLDLGFASARELTRRVLGDQIQELCERGGMDRDAKSRLQEVAQARGLQHPRYRVVEVEGPAHELSFTVEVMVCAPAAYSAAAPASAPVDHDERVRRASAPGGERGRLGEVAALGRGQGRSKKEAEQQAARAALTQLRPEPPGERGAAAG